ncbi:HD domain-containing protein [Paenibacillus sabinae]|uniref:Metal dependent phosphohydrolase n=1 Tax=Paenibacillus sabinae T27 TaxID=1268072 RepID=X4ZMU9_9BACL|nr:HD domain-containing protein [Paenibacillus sabinae]AHV97925.1 metal dependent phosphohydrolase [Paenibacillus sabinae T27]
MDKERVLEKTNQFVKDKLEGEGSGHDWWHIVRVRNNALDIARQTDGADCFIVELGALLHDIADHKFGYTDEDRRRIISELLIDLEVSNEVIEEVIYIANHISYKGGTNKHTLSTIEAKIVQDADRLDAIGALGIARTFAYGGHVNRPIYHPASDEEAGKVTDGSSENDTISHFYDKLLLLKDLMNTEIGAQKAQKRHDTMVEFLDHFYAEWNGEN